MRALVNEKSNFATTVYVKNNLNTSLKLIISLIGKC